MEAGKYDTMFTRTKSTYKEERLLKRLNVPSKIVERELLCRSL